MREQSGADRTELPDADVLMATGLVLAALVPRPRFGPPRPHRSAHVDCAPGLYQARAAEILSNPHKWRVWSAELDRLTGRPVTPRDEQIDALAEHPELFGLDEVAALLWGLLRRLGPGEQRAAPDRLKPVLRSLGRVARNH